MNIIIDTKTYLGNPNGKTTFSGDFILAQVVVTMVQYALLIEIMIHTYCRTYFLILECNYVLNCEIDRNET